MHWLDTPPLVMVGQTVSHYRVVGELGSGGMGVVYKAEDVRLGRRVALKFLPAQLASHPAIVERFEREARAASKLNHPHICTIYDIDEHEGRRFIVMELLEGATVQAHISAGPIDIRKLLEWGIQIAEALALAHQEGIVHRDIKPANIFVTDRSQVKILDFGLVKVERVQVAGKAEGQSPEQSTDSSSISLTERGVPVGTWAYMSPEQARGEEIDGRADVFSCGAVLYEMASGQPAFKGNTPALLHDAILNRSPVPPRNLNPDVPARLERIISKAIEKDREARYQNASELSADLRQLKLQFDSQRGGPLFTGIAARGSASFWRGPTKWALATSLALLVITAVALNPRWLRERLPWLGTKQINSLAVLPLTNLANDPEQDYIADGMTEALITDLAKIRNLRVISRTSVMTYKGVTKPLPQIARELGVDAIVEGSVMRSGDRIRITAQLIDAEADRHLWADSYEREMHDLMGLQREVARTIAREVRVQLSQGEQEVLAAPSPVDPKAYEAYLRGRFYWNRRTAQGVLKSIDTFQTALAIDNNYALAHSGLADAYIAVGVNDYGFMRPREAMAQAKVEAMKALAIDPTLAEAHTSLASSLLHHDWDFAGAENEYRRAIELNPSYATAHHWYAFCLTAMGRGEKALEEIRLARQLDPLSLIINANVGWILFLNRRYDEALEEFRRTLELDADFGVARIYRGLTYEQLRRYDEAVAEFREALERSNPSPPLTGALARSLALAGGEAEAHKLLRSLLEQSRSGYVPPHLIARVYLGMGENELALDWLEKAFDERVADLIYLNADPAFDSVRSSSRFQKMLERMNFPK